LNDPATTEIYTPAKGLASTMSQSFPAMLNKPVLRANSFYRVEAAGRLTDSLLSSKVREINGLEAPRQYFQSPVLIGYNNDVSLHG
jgi:hypothetical protein